MINNNKNTQANLFKQVFDKDAFNNTIDNNFKELLPSDDPSFFSLDLATIGDFFELYLRFFNEIPKLGNVNSHEYLAKTSGEYINYQPQQAEIQALLEEISQLREENLQMRLDYATAIQAQYENAKEEISAAQQLVNESKEEIAALQNQQLTTPLSAPVNTNLQGGGNDNGGGGGGPTPNSDGYSIQF